MKKSHHILLRSNLIWSSIVIFSLLVLFVEATSASVTLFGPKGFQRTTGKPDVFRETFTATEGTGLLELFNGGMSAGSQVTSAWVTLNGKQVLGPDDFKKGDALLQLPIALQAQNNLEIRLASKPQTYIVVRLTQDFPFEEDNSGIIKTDLAVTDLVLTPDRCAPQTDVSVKATVTNWGREDSGPATLVFTADGNEIGRVNVDALPVAANASFSIDWVAQEPGRHNIWARVEPKAGMIDTHPANDSRLSTLRVSGESPAVPEVEFAPPEFEPGPTAIITVEVQNPSFADLDNVQILLYVEDPSLPLPAIQQFQPNGLFDVFPPDICPELPCLPPYVTIESLPAGTSQKVSFPWMYGDEGHFFVQVSARHPINTFTASYDLVLPSISAIWPTNQPKWSSMGPYLITDENEQGPPNTGRIATLAVHPQNPNIIYAASSNYGARISGAGLWKTTDGGQSWTPLGDKFPQMNIMAIALDPKDPDIVYCAGGPWYFDPPTPVSAGLPNPITGYIFKSIDGGQHWHIFGHPADGYSKLVVYRFFGDQDVMIYAASNRGVFRYLGDDPYALSDQDPDFSEWSLILDGKISDLVMSPENPGLVFAVKYSNTNQLDGLYRTKNGVSFNPTWEPIFKLGPNPERHMFLDIFKSNPQKVYLLTTDQTLWELRISGNGGDDFGLAYSFPVPVAYSGDPPLMSEATFLRAHPAVENFVYVGANPKNLFILCNLSGSWLRTTVPNIHADQHTMEFYPNSNALSGWGNFLGNDGGVYRGELLFNNPFVFPSFDLSNLIVERMTPINNGLITAEFYDTGFDVSPIDPNVMIGGTQDNGVILYQPNSNPYGQWKYCGTGDGTGAVIAPSEPKTMYRKDSDGLHSGITRSTNGGDDWEETEHRGVVDGGGPIFTDPVFPNHIFVGGQQVQASNNRGDDWEQIGPSDPNKLGDVVQVLMKPVTLLAGEVLYAGTNKYGQLWAGVWTPGGWQWDLVDKHPDPNAYVVSMAFAPSNPDLLYVVYDGCTKDYRLRRFLYTQGRWVWEWIKGNLPEIHATTKTKLEIHTIAVHPTHQITIFLGTDKGVYQGTDLGGTWRWVPFNNGLPLVLISKLISLPPPTNEIRAATSGRGVWRVSP